MHATVSPFKGGAIDGRLRSVTQITLHSSSWHVLKPETAKRNDRNDCNDYYDYNKTTTMIEQLKLSFDTYI